MAQVTAVISATAMALLSIPTPAQHPVWAAMVWAFTAATRPLTIRQAGTNFARVLAMCLGPALATSDWRS